MSRTASFLSASERSLPAASVGPEDVVASVAPRLAEVERLFRENLTSPLAIVGEIGEFVAQGSGKRVRPTLHLLAADLCGYVGPHDVTLATVLEFIHSATLIHDDVIDEASIRRGRPSVNRRWGNTITVLFGDYLYAKAMELALGAGSLRVMDRLAWITLRMTEGEMLQTRYAGRIDLPMADYLGLIERKTAVLFGGCCELAAILADVDEVDEGRLRQYGLQMGMAFQIVDDLLDFTGDPDVLGKPIASDLREGKVTLPVIDLLQQDPAASDLVARIALGASRPDDGSALTQLLRDSGAIARAENRARDHADRALEVLESFPDGPARRALQGVPELLIARNR